jgi:DNA processing protein
MEDSIETIKISDPDFPTELKTIPQPPKVIYTQGRRIKEEMRVAIVGTRMCSDYGKLVASNIAQGLVDAGVVIVSGLAPGIDTIAHTIAVENKARTIAVIGSGLDKKSIYPQTNVVLAQKILDCGGLLVSEYPEGTSGAKFTFPRRNRIISGLSLAVVVIEAKERSGSLITAEWARKQGKKIFAVPGSIYSANSRGCHYLIRQGAILAQNAKDILDGLGIEHIEPLIGKTAIEGSEEEVAILKSLREGALDVDKIILITGLPAKKVLSILPVLEIEGKIKDLGKNIYALSHC